MILDVEKCGQKVVTPQGTGTIVIIEEDFVNLKKYALVKLDEDKSIKRYTEYELDTITDEPKEESVQD